MRFKVPKNGQRWKTISGTPGAILSLIYLAVVLLMVVAFFFLDSWVLGQRFNDPPKWYHWVVLSFFLLLMCMGGVIIEHRYGSKKQLVTCQEGSNKIDENVSKKEL
jgi:hypothetical protein